MPIVVLCSPVMMDAPLNELPSPGEALAGRKMPGRTRRRHARCRFLNDQVGGVDELAARALERVEEETPVARPKA